MLRLWLSPRLMLAFGLHTVVPSESEMLRLMLNCDRTSFWRVSGWLKYVAESANVEPAWLIFIYILFKSIAQHLAERVEDVESCSNSYWISGRATAGSKPRDCRGFICDFYFGYMRGELHFQVFSDTGRSIFIVYNTIFHALVGTAHKSQSSNRLPAVSVNVTTSPPTCLFLTTPQ